jgi:hypothetical protein
MDEFGQHFLRLFYGERLVVGLRDLLRLKLRDLPLFFILISCLHVLFQLLLAQFSFHLEVLQLLDLIFYEFILD